MCADLPSSEYLENRQQGRQNYREGHAFEERVAEAYRLLGYRVDLGRFFYGRQVDIFLELAHGDLLIRRAVECKVGVVNADDLDKFLIKLNLVRKDYPDAQGTLVGALAFTDAVSTHAAAIGIQLTSFRDLSALILDGPAYAQRLIAEIEENERYRPSLFVQPMTAYEAQ